MEYLDRHDSRTRTWVAEAIRKVEADTNRSSDTHLHVFPLPSHWGVNLYLKDESVHPTGSLKHRLARSLFLYGLANGWIGPTTTVVEASSGSTAVSEAYFARLIGVPFIAVMPASTSPEKIALIEFQGGKCHLVDDPGAIYAESHRLAAESGGFFMDQFTYAERATDWRGNNNIAESIFHQMSMEPYPVPAWIVVGAGTGGTSSTIGRYIRYRCHSTRLAVVDPEGSAFYASWKSGDPDATALGSRIEGIGRPRVEPSFLPGVIDRMIQVPDARSIAAMRWASEVTGRDVGGSTGTNLAAVVELIKEMREAGEQGSIVTLICDGGERYRGTYDNDAWLAERDLDIHPHLADLRAFLAS
ncbi:PLP-dependent cysteine synthase family protein [Nonomuraea sp. NPDC046570]|uniref:PLP-dependent cysteine synthase family protein n=1 Tax=Nonomuraea sp. NPDC046570 TaxID=3155255 RepID=UPI0033F5AC9B